MLTYLLLLFAALGPILAYAQNAAEVFRSQYETQVFFAFDRSHIRPKDTSALQEVATHWRAAGAGALIRICAHADAVGSEDYNLRLSARRAQAVAAALQRLGVEAQAIEQTYEGEAKPLADNQTEEGRQRNRRAEIKVLVAPPSAPPVFMETLTGRVTDQKTGKPVQATVLISTSSLRDSLQTDEEGAFSAQLPRGAVAKLTIFAPGYFFNAQTVRVGIDPPSLNIGLPPATPGEKIALHNLLFYGNKAVLLPQSEDELPKILRFMQLNPTVRIEIAGHINNPLKTPEELDQWEWRLSVNRAKLVYDYLLQNGIAPERMYYKGYGNTEMIYSSPHATEEQQEQNRRVEIRIQ